MPVLANPNLHISRKNFMAVHYVAPWRSMMKVPCDGTSIYVGNGLEMMDSSHYNWHLNKGLHFE